MCLNVLLKNSCWVIFASIVSLPKKSTSAGALPQTPLGELTALLRSLAGFKGPTSKERVGTGMKGRGGKAMEGEGRGLVGRGE